MNTRPNAELIEHLKFLDLIPTDYHDLIHVDDETDAVYVSCNECGTQKPIADMLLNMNYGDIECPDCNTDDQEDYHMCARSRNSKFQPGSGVYVCVSCGKRTRETGNSESYCQLCAACYDEAGWENEHNDNDGKHALADGTYGPAPDYCPICRDEQNKNRENEKGSSNRLDPGSNKPHNDLVDKGNAVDVPKTKRSLKGARIMSTETITVGQTVIVTVADELIEAEVLRVFKNGKARLRLATGTTGNYNIDELQGKRGRKPMSETMTDKEMADEVNGLLAELESCDDQDEKKRIRRALRRRGHTGGLRNRDDVK